MSHSHIFMYIYLSPFNFFYNRIYSSPPLVPGHDVSDQLYLNAFVLVNPSALVLYARPSKHDMHVSMGNLGRTTNQKFLFQMRSSRTRFTATSLSTFARPLTCAPRLPLRFSQCI